MNTKEFAPTTYWKSILEQHKREENAQEYYHPWIRLVREHLIDEWYSACEKHVIKIENTKGDIVRSP
jgi:hypothetical protein